MFRGNYKAWNPVPAIQGERLYLEAVHDDWEGFRVWFRHHEPSRQVLIFKFETPIAHFASNESYRIAGFKPEPESDPGNIWTVEQSELVELVRRQSAGTMSADEMTHFVLLSSEDCIDVVAATQPGITYDL